MMADGLTKALSRGPFDRFTEMIGLVDQEGRLQSIRREEDLREQLKELKSDERSMKDRYTLSKDVRNSP